jgi:cytochrome c553
MSARRAAVAIVAALAAAATFAVAQSTGKPYASGDAAAGKALADKDCNACHARQFDGNATRIYTRPDRRVKTPAQLLTQITYCNTQLSLSYFPEEEADIAAYLDQEHYHFAP